MDEFSENCVFSTVESSKCKLYDVPVNSCQRGHCPLKFFLQVMKVLILHGSIVKGSLQLADDNLPMYAKMGVASVSTRILV